MSVARRMESVDPLWDLRDVLASEGPGVGLPLVLLEGLRQVIGCDAVAFNDVDSHAERHWFWQTAEADGAGEAVDEPPDDSERVFWEEYWSGSCSWPDQGGDLSCVVLHSDFVTALEHHRSREYNEGVFNWEHDMMAVWPNGSPGRTLRLICIREDGTDFDERDRFLVQLLRPHLYAAYQQSQATRESSSGAGAAALTPRQRDVLALVREGATNYAIGRRLGISEGTVRTHLQNSYAVLGVSSRTAAAMALRELEDIESRLA